MPSTPDFNLICPCGSGQQYSACCRPFHDGVSAPCPEALMRSRFSAYVFRLESYLISTWHASTRPLSLDMNDQPDWTALTILSTNEPAHKSAVEGTVAFRAVHRESNGWHYLEETSRFKNVDGHWLYVDGDVRTGTLKPQRNEPCPCGSGEKFKRCCL